MKFRYETVPHPHLRVDEIVSPDTYGSLRFPDTVAGDDRAWGLTMADPAYTAVRADPGWGPLVEQLISPTLVRTILDEFRDDMRRFGCRVDPDEAVLLEYVETRQEKEQALLATGGHPNELFVRVDFQSKGTTDYREFVHLDWPRRVVGGILYFCDAETDGIAGGELAFYVDRRFADDRRCHDAELATTFAPVANTGVLFLNHNGSFHGPTRIETCRGRRRWLYYAISSKVDVWPARPE